MLISLLLALSSICSSHNTIHYTSHHYEFNYLELINNSNSNTLINDNNILIRIINSSSLSYIINNEYTLNFFNDSNFNEISYKYLSILPFTKPQRRLIENTNEKSGIVSAEASGKSFSMKCSNGKIKVIEASYGRNCKHTNLNNQLNNLKNVCNNKQQCKYKIEHLKIGDAAPGCAKTYIYKYKCGYGTNYKLPNININNMNNLHLSKHRNTLKKHLSNIKESILNEMKQSFKENNEQTILLQQIDNLKQKQTELDLKHKIFEIKKNERRELNKDQNRIMKQEINYEKQARNDRQKLMKQKQKYIKEEYNMKIKEHKELMNGLKLFINNWSKLIQQKQQQINNKYNIGIGRKKKNLMVPMPPLPITMTNKMQYVRRLTQINDEYININGVKEIYKCLNCVFGKICMNYNNKKGIIGFDVMMLENEKMNMIKENNEMKKKYIVYQYVFGINNISQCDGIINDMRMFGMCYRDNNVMIYFNNEGVNGIFEIYWMDESLWDEVVVFVSEKQIMKCVDIDLMMTKLCVGWNEQEDIFVVELKVLLVDE